ncbi:hypothetical protein [Marisediminicola senii]|uniref:hypothetical protein n=1 Tax=Marisediminicola senii TaxID=2711233 RepID=UPI001913D7AB|nr:hypothetical protein [Marisediminicola senii]
MARTNTRRMHALRDEFFLEGQTQSRSTDPTIRALSHCWRCRQPIDYNVAPHSTDDSHNLGHYKNVDDFPELQEDRDNFRHEHRLCNLHAGKRMHSLGLGDAVADWW